MNKKNFKIKKIPSEMISEMERYISEIENRKQPDGLYRITDIDGNKVTFENEKNSFQITVTIREVLEKMKVGQSLNIKSDDKS